MNERAGRCGGQEPVPVKAAGISVDTWRHEVGRAACEAGAHLLNDTWGGWDPALAEVAAEFDAGLVCSHAGGLPPRTRPFRAHDIRQTRQVLDMVAAIKGDLEPVRIIRGLA
jgi:dihydropteroate synthase